jgi:hypothetical protein
MRESRREAVWRGLRSLHADAPRRKEYLRERSSEPGRLCTPSGSRGAGMQRKDIFSRLTLVAGFPTVSDRLLRPYATRAQAGRERSCCQRPARLALVDRRA